MAVAFPSGYTIGRDTTVVDSFNTTTDEMDDGSLQVRVLGPSFSEISLSIKMMTRTEMDVLLSFLKENRTEQITLTIDDIDYIGRMVGPVRRTMTGIFYNLEFSYRATEA